MTSFTCVSWVCVLALLFLGQSSDAEHLTEMDERRSVVENYVQKELDALEKKLKTEIDENTALQNEVKQLKEADKQLKEAVKKQVSTTRCLAQKVGFMATFAQNGGTTVSRGQTVIYDKVITNVGNSYNPGNGRFTATNPGLYAFTLTAFTLIPKHVTDLKLKVNDGFVTSEYSLNKSYNAASAHAVVQLSAGDVVTVEASVYYSHHTMYQWSDQPYNVNTFSGALIQPDCPQ